MNVKFPNESEEYRNSRNILLEKEIDLRREMEAVAELRRKLPVGGEIPEDYVFEKIDKDGNIKAIKFSELFIPGKDTLVVYNFMFPRECCDTRSGLKTGKTSLLPLEEGPCPSCSAFLIELESIVKSISQKVNFVVVAKASPQKLLDFSNDMGFKNLNILSAENNSYKKDYYGENEKGDQMPMLNVFHKDGEKLRHFWSSELFFAPADPGQDPRHTGTLDTVWNMFDLTPEGREGDFEDNFS